MAVRIHVPGKRVCADRDGGGSGARRVHCTGREFGRGATHDARHGLGAGGTVVAYPPFLSSSSCSSSFISAGSGGWYSGPFCPQPAASTSHGSAAARRNALRRLKDPDRSGRDEGVVRCMVGV